MQIVLNCKKNIEFIAELVSFPRKAEINGARKNDLMKKKKTFLPRREICILLIKMFKGLRCLRLKRRFSRQALKDDGTKAPQIGL